MKFSTTLFALSLLLFISCSAEDPHDIPLTHAYVPFNKALSVSKTLVQEVLVAAYQNPDLINAQEEEEMASNRSDCPQQEDQNPNEFPKTLIFTYSAGCMTDSNNEMSGELEVYVSDKIGVPGMEIILSPRADFSINGSTLGLNGSNAQFKSTYLNTANGEDNYLLDISGLDIITEDQEVYQIIEMVDGTINFRDVDGNNGNSTSPVNYFDDLAIIDFEIMSFLNNDNEKMEATVNLAMSFDLFCNCPLEGKVNIRSEDDKTQIVDFTSNLNCGGTIIVDVEEVDCRG